MPENAVDRPATAVSDSWGALLPRLLGTRIRLILTRLGDLDAAEEHFHPRAHDLDRTRTLADLGGIRLRQGSAAYAYARESRRSDPALPGDRRCTGAVRAPQPVASLHTFATSPQPPKKTNPAPRSR
ncbi:MAG TPA: hypothetical protein VIS09_31155 [Streptomyces sp.]